MHQKGNLSGKHFDMSQKEYKRLLKPRGQNTVKKKKNKTKQNQKQLKTKQKPKPSNSPREWILYQTSFFLFKKE